MIVRMHYLSTRGGGAPLPFCATVLTGLARDGGLFLPQEIPDVRDRLSAWSRLSYPELAVAIMGLYADDIPPAVLRALVTRSYAGFRHPEVTPVVSAGDLHVLELFHGPTLAFKDVALQFLGNLFEYVLAQSGGELNIVAATSGDTGSAAIHGVRGRDRMRISPCPIKSVRFLAWKVVAIGLGCAVVIACGSLFCIRRGG